ncbi:hypothetical protein [Legionella sp. PC997]|uniref:type IV pilus modification PilV family protein n=1 Tax=Legionella sp. PC997 TaxID=2755562 RepID=UPI0015FAE817|nr:hypothetical protein [Legionella sp. PC997]QMT59548.1 hypothetical protein HBNCFIEN_00914 [Legionella sp. PC997]
MNTHQFNSTSCKQKGLGLVEAMVVTSLLIFGMVAGSKTEVHLIKAKANTNQDYLSTQLFNQKMEELRNYSTIAGYNAITTGSDITTEFDSTFYRTWTITNNSKYKKVDHIVTWTNSNGENLSMVSASYISQNDPALSGQLFNSTFTSTSLPPIGSGVPNADPNPNPPSVPSGSTYTVTVPNTNIVLTYDSNNNVTLINSEHAVTLSGTIALGTGGNAPPNTVDLSNVTISVDSSNSQTATCFYVGSSAAFNCIMASSWSGRVLLGGVSNVNVCTSNQQPYTNLLTSLNNQDYLIIKSNRNCPSSNPFLLQSL